MYLPSHSYFQYLVLRGCDVDGGQTRVELTSNLKWDVNPSTFFREIERLGEYIDKDHSTSKPEMGRPKFRFTTNNEGKEKIRDLSKFYNIPKI
ncbi:hypothetical protein CMI42_04240 [Candidatus Pacearchaeota archaeon]|nr:hypothetical protein [Candidatus Pacearchaeota archaeon]